MKNWNSVNIVRLFLFLSELKRFTLCPSYIYCVKPALNSCYIYTEGENREKRVFVKKKPQNPLFYVLMAHSLTVFIPTMGFC